jgi:hypothetical protein
MDLEAVVPKEFYGGRAAMSIGIIVRRRLRE